MKYNWMTRPCIDITSLFEQSSTNTGLQSHSDKEISDIPEKKCLEDFSIIENHMHGKDSINNFELETPGLCRVCTLVWGL